MGSGQSVGGMECTRHPEPKTTGLLPSPEASGEGLGVSAEILRFSPNDK